MSQYHLPRVRWRQSTSQEPMITTSNKLEASASYKSRLIRRQHTKVTPLISILLLCTLSLPLLNAQSSSGDGEYSEPVTFYGDEAHCKGEWRHPANCESVTCDYKATWEYHDEGDEIVFTISTKNRNKWTGIGFSENQAMPETDTILGLVEERFVFLFYISNFLLFLLMFFVFSLIKVGV